jgi:hypothetical protein
MLVFTVSAGLRESPLEQRPAAARLGEEQRARTQGQMPTCAHSSPWGFPCFQWGLKMMSLLVDKKALMDILIFLAVLQGIFLCVSVCLCALFYRLM